MAKVPRPHIERSYTWHKQQYNFPDTPYLSEYMYVEIGYSNDSVRNITKQNFEVLLPDTVVWDYTFLKGITLTTLISVSKRK